MHTDTTGVEEPRNQIQSVPKQTRGVVIRGQGYPHKVPTANLIPETFVPPGVYWAEAKINGDEFRQAIVWSIPGVPYIEVFIAQWDESLYGQVIVLEQFRVLTREIQKALFEVALSSLPRIIGTS
jgi:FAD synthase